MSAADAAALAGLQVVYHGKPLADEARPEVLDGVAMISLKHIFEAAGGELYWFSAEKRARGVTAGADLAVQIGSTHATLNGEVSELAAAPALRNNRIMVPVSLVAKALSLKFELDPTSKRIIVSGR